MHQWKFTMDFANHFNKLIEEELNENLAVFVLESCKIG